MRLSNLRLSYKSTDVNAVITLLEDGTPTEIRLPLAEAQELCEHISQAYCLSYGYEKDGRGISVSVPDDTSYVPRTQTVYLVCHPVYETQTATFDKREARSLRAQEVRSARESFADVPRALVSDYERENATRYYVSAYSLAELDVPDEVRLCGRTAVLRYLSEGN